MKKIKLLPVILFTGLVILISACSQPDQHLNTIPATAKMVGSANLFSLAKKAELYNLSQYAYYEESMQKLREKNPELHAYLAKIISNPLKTGIRYREDLYFFTEGSDNKTYVGFTMSLRNHKDFDTFISSLATKTKGNQKIINKDGMHYMSDTNMVLVYDREKMMMVARENANKQELYSYARTLMEQDKEASIAMHSDFKTFRKTQEDINIWLATDKFSKSPRTAMIQSQLPFKASENYLHSYLEFKDEGIFASIEMTFNEEIQAILEDYNFIKKSFNTELLKYFPRQNFLTIGAALNPQQLYKYLNDIPSYKKLLDQAGQNAPLSIKTFINSLEGDIIMGFHGMEFPGNNEKTKGEKRATEIKPYLTAVVAMKNEAIFEQIISKIIPPGFVEERDNMYASTIKGIDVYFGLYDNNLVFTNHPEVIEAAKSGGPDQNLGSADHADLYDHSSYMYINLDWKNYPNSFHDAINQNFGQQQKAAFENMEQYLHSLRIYSNRIGKNQVELLMQNTDGNALHTILKVMDQNRDKFKKSTPKEKLTASK